MFGSAGIDLQATDGARSRLVVRTAAAFGGLSLISALALVGLRVLGIVSSPVLSSLLTTLVLAGLIVAGTIWLARANKYRMATLIFLIPI